MVSISSDVFHSTMSNTISNTVTICWQPHELQFPLHQSWHHCNSQMRYILIPLQFLATNTASIA